MVQSNVALPSITSGEK